MSNLSRLGEGGIRQKTTELEMNAFLLVPLLRTRYPHACFVSFLPQVKHQSSVNTFLPGFGNGWLKYCAILRAILET